MAEASIAGSANFKVGKINLSGMKNIGSSIGRGVSTYIKSVTPTATDIVETAASSISSVKSNFGKKGDINTRLRELKNMPSIRSVFKLFTGVEENAENDTTGNDFFDNLDFDTDISDSGESSTLSGLSKVSDHQISNDDKNTSKLIDAMIKGNRGVVESQLSIAANISTSLDETKAVISTGFETVNSTLNQILEVLTRNTAAIIETNEARSYGNEESPEEKILSERFKIKEYKNLVKGNISRKAEPATTLLEIASTVFSGSKEDTIETLAGYAINGLLNNKKVKLGNNLKVLDEAVNNIITNSLIRIGNTRYSGSGVKTDAKNFFASIFGIEGKRNAFDSNRADLELKSVPFDSVAKEAITGAIPGYLRKILVALGGNDEIYDYKSRRFTTKKAIERNFRQNINLINNLDLIARNKIYGSNAARRNFDLMMEDIGANTGRYGNAKQTLDSFSNKDEIVKYFKNLNNGKFNTSNKANEKFIEDFFKFIQSGGANSILTQAARNNITRSNTAKNILDEYDRYSMDVSFIKENQNKDRKAINRMYGISSSIGSDSRNKNPSKPLYGLDYTNMALYEIYRRLNEGINVFQVGSKRIYRDKFKRLDDTYLVRPGKYKPKGIPNVRGNGGSSGSVSDEDEDIPPINPSDGSPDSPSGGGRIGKKLGRFGKAMLSGNPDEVNKAIDDLVSEAGKFGKRKVRQGAKSINDRYGNITGSIKHTLFGSEYSYEDVDPNDPTKKITKTVAKNEKGGIFGYAKDKSMRLFDSAKATANDYFKKVSSIFADAFDDGSGKKKDATVEAKRNKIIKTSVGALAGAGILGGPFGILAGVITANAIGSSGTGLGKKINEKLFGKEVDDKGRIKGFFPRMLDKVFTPIQYQFAKTADHLKKNINKHILGPLSDLGTAIKDRITTSAEKHFGGFFKKIVGGIGKIIGTPIKFLSNLLFGGATKAAGGAARGAITVGAKGADTFISRMADMVSFGAVHTDENGNVISSHQNLKQRRRDRKSQKDDKYMSYKDYRDQKRNKRNSDSSEISEYTEEVVSATEEVKDKTAEVSEHIKETNDILNDILDTVSGTPNKRGSKKKESDKSSSTVSVASDVDDDKELANAAVGAASTIAISSDTVSESESKATGEIIDESAKSRPNKGKLVSRLKSLLSSQTKKSKEEGEVKEEKESWLKKILDNIPAIALSAAGLLALLNNPDGVIGGLKTILSGVGNAINNISDAVSGIHDFFVHGEGPDGQDAVETGINMALSPLDMQVEGMESFLPGANISHNDRTGGGSLIRNSSATKAKDQIMWRAGLTKMLRNTGTISEKALNKAEKYEAKANELSTKGGFINNIRSYFARKKSDTNLEKAIKYEPSTRGAIKSTATNYAKLGVLYGASKLAGGAVNMGAQLFGVDEEAAKKAGDIASVGTSAVLTVGMIKKGNKSFVHKTANAAIEGAEKLGGAAKNSKLLKKILDGFKNFFSKLSEKITTNEKFQKLVGSKGVSKLKSTLQDIPSKLGKKVSDEFTDEMGEAVEKKTAEMTGKQAVGSTGVGIAAGAVVGLMSGLCNVEYLFQVAPGDADAKMRVIAAILEAAFGAIEMIPGFGWIICVIDVLGALIQAFFGRDIRQWLAQTIYQLGSSKSKETLAQKQSTFKGLTDQYNATYGTSLEVNDMNDLVNNSGIFDRIWRGKVKTEKDENGNIIGFKEGTFNDAGERRNKGLKGLISSNDYEYERDAEGNILYDEHGKAIIKTDEKGHKVVKSKRKIGNWFSDRFSDIKAVVSGGSTVERDENGQIIQSEDGTVEKVDNASLAGYVKGDNSLVDVFKENKGFGAKMAALEGAVPATLLKGGAAIVNGINGLFKKKNKEEVVKDADGEPVIAESTDKDGKTVSTEVTMDNFEDVFKTSYNSTVSNLMNTFNAANEASSNSDLNFPEIKGFKLDEKSFKDGYLIVPASQNNLNALQGQGVGGLVNNTEAVNDSTKTDIGTGSVIDNSTNPFKKAAKIISGFGYPKNRPTKDKHLGVDIVPEDGKNDNADVYSSYNGTIVDVKRDIKNNMHATYDNQGNPHFEGTAYQQTGNMVSIQTNDGLTIKNMHLKYGSIPDSIQVGTPIKIGDKIGVMGNTGWSTGPHLHYQVEQGGSAISPLDQLRSPTNRASSADDTSDTYTSGSISSIDSSGSTKSGGILSKLISALGSFASGIFSKLTGGFAGDEMSEDTDVDFNLDSSSSSNISAGPLPNVGPCNSWIEIVKGVKKITAANNPTYWTDGGKYFDVTLNGKTISTRPDCSGIVTTMLKFYGSIPDDANMTSSTFVSTDSINGFTKSKFPGWDSLVEGDIIAVYGGGSHHVEVFANNNGGKHMVYNGGSTKALRSAGPTVSGHKTYDVVFRCNGNSMTVSGDASKIVGSNAEEVFKALKKRGFSDAAAAGILGVWQEESHNDSKNFEGSFLFGNKDDAYNKYFKDNQSMNDYMETILIPKTKNIRPKDYKGADGNYYPGMGLAQWTGSRHYNLMKYASDNNKDWRDMNSQIDFAISEMSGRGVDASFKNSDSATDAAETWARKFEGTSNATYLSKRKSNASVYYDQYKGKYDNAGNEIGLGGPITEIPGEASRIRNTLNYSRRKSSPNKLYNTNTLSYKNGIDRFLDTDSYPETSKNVTSNTDLTQVTYLLRQVVTELEAITTNTGTSNDLLNAIGENGIVDKGLRDTLKSIKTPGRTTPAALPHQGNTRMITAMTRA